MSETAADLKRTPLYALHLDLGARMVPFAGYEMPVQYRAGILAEHQHCRSGAALFDVSHMGQAVLRGPRVLEAFEALAPVDLEGLAPGRIRYSYFTNAAGGILDDLMVTRQEEGLFLVVNAARKAADLAHLESGLGSGATVELLAERALVALQGPKAAAVLARLAPGAERLAFMSSAELAIAGASCRISRSGYTGEDGFEISLPSVEAETVARRLLAEPEVAPAGLGARDSLRLEAGLCLYGHDIDETTTPVEAGIAWAIFKRRRAEGGFPGDKVILRQLAEGPPRRRVGLLPEGRAPLREGCELLDREGRSVGRVTSGGFGPTVGAPVAMGYLPSALAGPGSEVTAVLRGRSVATKVARLPFVPLNYVRT